MKKIMIVFGTRPEAIKMCPLINELKKRSSFQTVVCVTGQHREMLDQVLEVFRVIPDHDLLIMKEQQSLTDVTCSILQKFGPILDHDLLIWFLFTEIPPQHSQPHFHAFTDRFPLGM